MLVTLLLLQTAGAAPDPVASLRAPAGCGQTSATGEVVVCGRRGESPYRAERLANPYASKWDGTASVAIPGVGKVSAEAQQVGGPSGTAPAAMARLKIRF